MPKELNHLRKGLISIQSSDDNKCLKWCLVKYSNPSDHHLPRIRKIDKDLARKLDFKFKKITVKIRDTHKIKKKNVSASVMRITRKYQSTFQKIFLRDIFLTIYLSKILERSCTIKHYIMIQNIFVVIACNILLLHKHQSNIDCFKINGKQMIKMAKKMKLLHLKTTREK